MALPSHNTIHPVQLLIGIISVADGTRGVNKPVQAVNHKPCQLEGAGRPVHAVLMQRAAKMMYHNSSAASRQEVISGIIYFLPSFGLVDNEASIVNAPLTPSPLDPTM
jgi:hypothetical protein